MNFFQIYLHTIIALIILSISIIIILYLFKKNHKNKENIIDKAHKEVAFEKNHPDDYLAYKKTKNKK